MTVGPDPNGEAWTIVLAAGRGERFGGFKQFHELAGTRLVDHVIHTALGVSAGVVVVVPVGHTWPSTPPTVVVEGGGSRSASVRCGLASVPSTADVIVVHDAAHPLATAELFCNVIDAVRAGAHAALPAVTLPDPVKRARHGQVVDTVDGDGLVWVQTPHAFRAGLLRELHEDSPDVREDTQLVEAVGGAVAVVPGDPRNLHVTSGPDLDLIRCISNSLRDHISTRDGCP